MNNLLRSYGDMVLLVDFLTHTWMMIHAYFVIFSGRHLVWLSSKEFMEKTLIYL